MNEFICFLAKYFFLVLSIVLFVTGFSCRFNLSKAITSFKINITKRKYTIIDEKEYLRFEGTYDLIIGCLSFISFLIVTLKEDLIFPVLTIEVIIINIIIYLYNNLKKDFLQNK
ncbi:hypothetical protein [Clostridium beijerinckii]|uniref:hypothetical protein n=1 Tax=Clostridium beijerinckii TaxID=1520 RepID=UPI00232C3345|nr:hypothetical protein [Clostridium beijerinckii]